ncbi:MAG: sulfur relay protein DsrC [Gammaproteobacteria bacterium]|nr:sulfur relay protein DsrC [Gammaproteobacteria bacterium]
MLKLSDILIEEFELSSYADLKEIIVKRAREGARFLEIDVKPPYKDTPANWEVDLENTFTSA